MARGGIEPPTQGFSILCSTDRQDRSLPFRYPKITKLKELLWGQERIGAILRLKELIIANDYDLFLT